MTMVYIQEEVAGLNFEKIKYLHALDHYKSKPSIKLGHYKSKLFVCTYMDKFSGATRHYQGDRIT